MVLERTAPRVAWSKLECATGKATRVGELLAMLREGARSERVWAFERLADLPIAGDAFLQAGLPSTPEDRKRFLGLAPPRPLDRLVKRGKREAPLWTVVADLQSRRADEATVLAAIVEAVPSKAEVLEVLAEMASCAHDLKSITAVGALQAFAAAGPAAADVARALAERMLARQRQGAHLGARPDFVNAVLAGLLRATGALDARYAPLVHVAWPHDVTTELLAALPLEQREGVLLRAVEPQWANPTRFVGSAVLNVGPHLALAPTGRLAARLLEMTDPKRLAVIDDAREAQLARAVALDALRPIARESDEVRAVLEKAGVA